MGSEPVDVTVRRWVVEILAGHPELIALAVRQRAKWEGWLKFELAARIERAGFRPVSVEEGYATGRSDITFHDGNVRYDVELKTPNTNWRMPGVQARTRPITMNIASIVTDARKLKLTPDRGIVCFVLFPVPIGSADWHRYLRRIANELGVSLTEEDHCSKHLVSLGTDNACDVIVCAFEYSPQEQARPTVSKRCVPIDGSVA